MKKMLAICLAACMAASAAFAQGNSGEPVTQAQLAEVLVRALGLVSSLPNPASDQQRFTALMQNGICPADGWTAGSAVTKKDLATVLVQALGAEDDVENPEDPASWLAVLQEYGIDLDSLGDPETVMGVEALPDAVTVDYGAESVDPLYADQSPAHVIETYYTTRETPVTVSPAVARETIVAAVTAVASTGSTGSHRRPNPTKH